MNRAILETWLKWLRKSEWYEVTDDIERLLLEPDRDVCWCGVPLAKPEMPTKIFGPNLEQILNAAGFYRREWVGLTDDDHEDFANRTKLLPILAKTMAEFIEAKLKKKNT